MITRLKVENFTAFDSLELEFGEGIQAFIGANGTGKTHLLKYLYCLLEIASESRMNSYSATNKIMNVFRARDVKNFARNRETPSSFLIEKDGDMLLSLSIEDGKFSVFNTFIEELKIRPTFIPVKDILENARGFQALYNLRETSFSEVYYDILTRAYLLRLKNPNPNYKPLLEKIEEFIDGKVESRDEELTLRDR